MGDNRTKYVLVGLVAVAAGLFAYRSCEPVRRCVSGFFSEKDSSRPLDGGTDRQSVGTAELKAEREKKEGVKGSDSKIGHSSGKTVDHRERGPPFVKVGELDDGEFDIFRFKPRRGKGKEQASNRFDDWDDSQGDNYWNTGSLNVVDRNGNPIERLYFGRPGYIKARPIGGSGANITPSVGGQAGGVADQVNAGGQAGTDAEGDVDIEFIYRLPVREGDPFTGHYRNDITDFLQVCLNRGERGEFMVVYSIDATGKPLRAVLQQVSGRPYPASCARELSELLLQQPSIPAPDGMFRSTKYVLAEEKQNDNNIK